MIVIDYDRIQQEINIFAKKILELIKKDYGSSMNSEQLDNIENLLNTEFIIIEKPNYEDIKFFSEQNGIKQSDDYSENFIPSAHGGRTKNDNKIHIYPYTKAFNACKNTDDVIKLCIDDLVIHEIFHYFIRPTMSNENDIIKEEFVHFITEGLVQNYSEEFAKRYKLNEPKSNYGKNVGFAEIIILTLHNYLPPEETDKLIMSLNLDQLLNMSEIIYLMYQEYVDDIIFKNNIISLITSAIENENINYENTMFFKEKNISLEKMIRYVKNNDDFEKIVNDLTMFFILIIDDKEKSEKYLTELQAILSERKSKIEDSSKKRNR